MSVSILSQTARFIGIIAALGVANLSFAATAPVTVDSVTTAAYRGQSATLKSFSETATGYTKAYALYRDAELGYAERAKADTMDLLERAASVLEGASADTDLESKVLLASIYGLMIGKNPELAQTLGAKYNELLNTAKSDPVVGARALLMSGISELHTPAEYGGGASTAEHTLKSAIPLFANATAERDISWGEAETYVWLGVAYARQGKEAEAREAFNKSMQVDPDCRWAYHFAKLNGVTL